MRSGLGMATFVGDLLSRFRCKSDPAAFQKCAIGQPFCQKKAKTDFGHQLVRGIWRIGKEIVCLKQPLAENTVVITGGSPRHKLHTLFARCCGARIFRKLVADRETAGPHANLRRWRARSTVLHFSVPETPPESEFPRVLVTAERKERYVRPIQGHKETSRPESF